MGTLDDLFDDPGSYSACVATKLSDDLHKNRLVLIRRKVLVEAIAKNDTLQHMYSKLCT